jgi:hypothetical protein
MLRLDVRRRSGTQVKPSCQARVRAVPCLCLLHPDIRLTTEKKAWEKPHRNDRSFAFHFIYAVMAFKGTKLHYALYTQQNRSGHKDDRPVASGYRKHRSFQFRPHTMLCDTDGPSRYFLEQTQCFRTNQTFYVVSISDSPSRVAK